MTKDRFGDLLNIFEKLSFWTAPITCRIQLRYNASIVSTSTRELFIAPVRPHNGKLVPLDEDNNSEALSYQENLGCQTISGTYVG
jgi:hypothetical protein